MRTPPKLADGEIYEDPIKCGVEDYKGLRERCPARSMCTQKCCGEGAYVNECVMQACVQDCNNCGGSNEFDRVTEESPMPGCPAYCVKSPLAEISFDLYFKEEFEVTPRDKLEFPQKSILLTNGRAGENTLYDPSTKTVAVSLRHVATGKGWRSPNIRKYLELPKDVTLISSTMMPDNFVEMYWCKELSEEDYRDAGFDYWHSVEHSVYGGRSYMNAIIPWLRSMADVETSGGHFTPWPPFFKLSDLGKRIAVNALRKVPNIAMSVQSLRFHGRDSRRMLINTLAELKALLKLVDFDVSVWFFGVSTPDTILNITRNFPGLDCYFVSSLAWITSHKGRLLKPNGKVTPRLGTPKRELVLENQRNYHKMVETAMRLARKS